MVITMNDSENEIINTEPIKELLEQDGIEKISINVKVKPYIRKKNTGVTDEHFQSVRERQVSKDEIKEIFEDTNWRYHGVVDAMHDFRVEDKITLSTKVDLKEDD